ILENFEGSIGCGKASSNSKLYVTIDLDVATVGQTRLLERTRTNPQWQESLRIYCAHLTSNVVFSIKEHNPNGEIGKAYMPAVELLQGGVNRWLQVMDKNHKPLHRHTKIHVKVQFFDAKKRHNWSKGIESPTFPGVPYTFFAQRNGCKVSLYQDAHLPDEFVPKITLAEGQQYEPHRCWEDIYDAISNAKHLIYITGWSVYIKITLVRDPRRQKPIGDIILGELLKKKADEGVRVLALVWDDRTSVKLLKNDGVIATHDEDTERYFKNSKVHCVLCPRNTDHEESIAPDIVISTLFTHHQKTVVVDGEYPNAELGKRRIVSFVGGIDLCDGRYDTPCHSLFRTLGTVHHNDFHQPNFTGASIVRGGPREPWHDIHCRLEGAIAWDVLLNFEQRWRRQGKEDLLLQLEELDGIIMPASSVVSPEDHETWRVRLVHWTGLDWTGRDWTGLDSTGQLCCPMMLISMPFGEQKTSSTLKTSTFLEVVALHLIPKELSLKIVSKIKAGERFMDYIVIPMWPEGIPESGSVQAILNWQNKTMEMMYGDIAEALHDKGLEANSKDYLSFFCLGNRELKKAREYAPPERPEPNSNYRRAQQSRRFMIYYHRDCAILLLCHFAVDDEYIIIGSANINQRSMDGARDTEIAMGAFQPHHLATKQAARGEIRGFRLSLWYEHLGLLEDSFLQLESLECVRKVNHTANKHWELYSSDKFVHDLPGHLLPYPVGVTTSGEIINFPGTEFFPDTRAHVLGSKSELLPPMLTT
ncbi:Phospholipase D, partial [Turnera subulata]